MDRDDIYKVSLKYYFNVYCAQKLNKTETKTKGEWNGGWDAYKSEL